MTSMEKQKKGHYHPLTLVERDLEKIFRKIGFSIASGPEVESEWYNFDALNVPKDHPARDMQDTFWIKGRPETVLRTHTSNVQIHYMQEHKPPIRMITMGRTYRNEATDATHEAVFHQIEGLMVDRNVTVGNLKATLTYFLSELFGEEVEVRLRPSFFPFVEPGFEVDAKRKDGGWLEILGAGMVHPNVLSNAGINPNEFQGFAFGTGMERLAVLKYGIDDVRVFLSGDLRIIEQF